MIAADVVIAELVGACASHEDGIVVDDVEIDVPIEFRIGPDGLKVSLPRSRIGTGFDAPIGRLRLRAGDAP